MKRALVVLSAALGSVAHGHVHAKAPPAHAAPSKPSPSKPPASKPSLSKPSASKPPAHGAAAAAAAPHVYARPAPPLPMLPSVARVRVEAAHDRVVVVQDVNLPRGDWQSGALDLYVAFGSPGTPLAVDAHLVPVAAGATEARMEDSGEPVTVEPAVHHTPSTQLLLGRPTMAGVTIRVPESALRQAYATSDLATLRIRSLLPPPAADAQGARDVVVRLGIEEGVPLTLGRVQVVSSEAQPWITRAEAHLCGKEADPWPLAVSILPRPTRPPPYSFPLPIVPAMAVRHSGDDLCVRWWATP